MIILNKDLQEYKANTEKAIENTKKEIEKIVENIERYKRLGFQDDVEEYMEKLEEAEHDLDKLLDMYYNDILSQEY